MKMKTEIKRKQTVPATRETAWTCARKLRNGPMTYGWPTVAGTSSDIPSGKSQTVCLSQRTRASENSPISFRNSQAASECQHLIVKGVLAVFAQSSGGVVKV